MRYFRAHLLIAVFVVALAEDNRDASYSNLRKRAFVAKQDGRVEQVG